MVEIINELNQTSSLRVIFYCFVFLGLTNIIVTGIVNMVQKTYKNLTLYWIMLILFITLIYLFY